MWGHGISVTAFVFSFLCMLHTSAAGVNGMEWKDVSNGVMDPELRIVAVNPVHPDTAYVSSYNTVYKTGDGGARWDDILSFRGTGNNINAVILSPKDPETVYTGTEEGLYRSRDGGLHWEKIFSGIGDSENRILSVAVHPDKPENIYIGTAGGMLSSEDNGNIWEKGNLPHGAVVTSIAISLSSPNIIFAAAEKGIYKSMNSGAGWKRVYSSGGSGDGVNSDTEEPEDMGFIYDIQIKTISISTEDHHKVYAATSEGLLITEDGGLTWKMANSLGLISRDIRHMAVVPSDTYGVYTATGRGVFRYSTDTGIWEELYKGLLSRDIRYIASARDDAPSGILWAVTGRGIFRTVSSEKSIDPEYSGQEEEDVLSAFAHEPEIGEILKAAIEYADVHPGKIYKWKQTVLKRAWLPELEFDYGKGRDWQSDRYYYSGKYVDDDISRGNDEGWSVSLTWELGDLVWSDDQTSEIDKRSEAMVELRDDILNEVTRLYYERRRLQAMMILSPQSDIREKISNKIRLQELTAGIDALTGSYFSKKLKTLKSDP